MKRPVYLDYAATTPVDPQVAAEMARCLTAEDGFGNAGSGHFFGRVAAQWIARARAQVATLIGAEAHEIIFTSGATESNNLAVLGVARANADRGRHIITSRIEHKSVLDVCRRLEREGFRVSWLTPDDSGRIDPQEVRGALRADTVLVSIQHVNNEIGVIQDIAAIGLACREAGVPLHTDMAQSAGRICLEATRLPVDFMSLTSHKLYGPKGIGALYVRRGARGLIAPQSFGGGQEQGLRPGTPATHQIVGFGAAAELAFRALGAEPERIGRLRDQLLSGLESLPGVHLNGAAAARVPHIVNLSFEEVDGESLIAALSMLAVSTGSACNSASGEPSYVLRALGRGTRLAESSLRLSLGRFTSGADIECAAAAIREQVSRLRAVAPRPADEAGRGAEGTEGARTLDSQPQGRIDDPAVVAAPEGVVDGLGSEAYRLFCALPRAGRPAERDGAKGGTVLCGEAGGPAEEVWVRFHVMLDGDTVKDARFEARGCPHTLAAAAWIASRLPGRRRDEGVPGDPHEWARQLGVPVEKLGRLLVLEDALIACGLAQSEADRR